MSASILESPIVSSLIQISYLVSAVLFILGLKLLNSPASARKGNQIASMGMLLAIVATLFYKGLFNYALIFTGLVVGGAIGYFAAKLVKMTAMPQMVGLFNGFGGGASALVASAEFIRLLRQNSFPLDTTFSIILGILIGWVTFTGSLIAFSKLQGLLTGAPITFPFQQPLNLLLLLVFVAGGAYILAFKQQVEIFIAISIVALILGVLFVIPIGGADMPVVISLLNSFSGLAASAAGFVLMNNALIVSGALVGASGLILTNIMCKAMNRSLVNVLFGAFGVGEVAPGTSALTDKSVRSIDAEQAAMILGYARRVIIVPGYGMAAAQAQHAVRELQEELQKRGVEVKYAIHPVAGRMPGHMNVLLAEANVPYSLLYDMDDINPEFVHTDVALVIGANDVVNPAARNQPGSPIYGMPILDVDKAQHVIIIKRSLNPGFSGIDNELFYMSKTMMLFGSAKQMVAQVVSQLKELD